VRAPTDRWHKEWMWLPGLLLFGLVVWLQRRRAKQQVPGSGSTTHHPHPGN